MDISFFRETLKEAAPPPRWNRSLQSLWWDARGDWHKAHDLADGLNTQAGSWIHAYLHRREGDEWNAAYWYNKAGKPFPRISLDEEFEELVGAMIRYT